MSQNITVETKINAPLEKVWTCWTTATHMMQWNNASGDWHTPAAIIDLTIGGKGNARMEAKDGSMGFDFGWTYTNIEPQTLLAYTLEDERKVTVQFKEIDNNHIQVTETFEAETENSLELQQQGWQAILDNFKKYVEGL